MVRRNVYLDNTPLDEAKRKYFDHLQEVQALEVVAAEEVNVDEALGRVTAEPVFAALSSPHYHASAMDGMAVDAQSTYGASETTPTRLNLGRDAIVVDTGDPLPAGKNAVIMIEDVHYTSETEIEIIAAVAPWQHVRPVGEDIVATEMLVSSHHRLRPADIGGILAGGHTRIRVFKRPKVAILPTGTELVQPGHKMMPGDIIEFNSRIIAGLVAEWGGDPIRYEITKDSYDLLKDRISRAVDEADIVVVNAGSSAGTEDFTSSLIQELGEMIVHGVAIKPGKPVILGSIKNKPVIGVPGYPVSAMLNCELFVKPVIEAKAGYTNPIRPIMKSSLSRKLVSPQGVDEFVRVKLGYVGGKAIATPISRGAGVLSSMMQADGILKAPRLSEGFEAGEEVEVQLLRTPEEIKNTTVMIGSHDVTLDLLANILQQKYPGRGLSSAHVGSLGGLLAIRRGEAHLAGIHLLDEETGEYNVAYIQKMLSEPVALINLLYRQQGFIVAKGNPLGIQDFTDLPLEGVRFINRQKGAGTRILLDYNLRQNNIEYSAIEGYDREEYTHMAVAVAVAGGSADVGLGIMAAANALDLDFVPITEERYDLVIPEVFMGTEHIDTLLDVIQTSQFQKSMEALGGYSARDTGKVFYRTVSNQ